MSTLALPLRRLYKYDEELEARGIERDSDRYREITTWAIQWLQRHRPFIGIILSGRSMIRRVTFCCPTIAVVCTQGRLELWMNPDFMALWSLRQNCAVFMHEATHILSDHLTLTERYGKGAYQDPAHIFASECVANSYVPKDWFPPGGIHASDFRVPTPGKEFEEWPQVTTRQPYQYYLEVFKKMSEESPWQIPATIGSEKLPKYIVIEGADIGSSSDLSEIDLGPGVVVGTIDIHDAWGVEEMDSPEIISHIVKSYIKECVEDARQQGVGAGDFAGLIEDLLKKKAVPFRRVFQSYFGRLVRVGRRMTMMRPSRRYARPPGYFADPDLDVLMFVDVSGSMSDSEVRCAFSEVKHASRLDGVRVRVQQFDWELQGPLMDLDVGRIEDKVEIHGRGGTRFGAAMDMINREQPDLALIVTDGGAERTQPPSCPVGWILTNGGDRQPHGWHIELPTEEEIKAGVKAKYVPKESSGSEEMPF